MPILTLDIPEGLDEAGVRLRLAIGLFQEGHVSVGWAAEMAELSYRDFHDALRDKGIPAFVYDDEEAFGEEISTVRELVQEIRQGRERRYR